VSWRIPSLECVHAAKQHLSLPLDTQSREIIRNNHELWKDFPPAVEAICPRLSTNAQSASALSDKRELGMAKHTKITIEFDSVLFLRGRRSLRAWCPECGAEGEMIRLDELGVVSNLAPPEAEVWIQSESLHQSKAADGAHLICLNSMLKRVSRTKSGSQGTD